MRGTAAWAKSNPWAVCGAALSDDSYLATWTGADICPNGPCLQRALDQADDDYATPEAVRAYAEQLSEGRDDIA